MQIPLLIDKKNPLGVIDRARFDEFLPKLSGHVTVELIDDSGDVVHREEGHNFISIGGYEALKRVMRGALSGKCPNASVESKDCAPRCGPLNIDNAFFSMMILTDDTSAESPTTEQTWSGNVIGWGTASLYSGADLKGGTISTTLSRAHNNGAKFVWEFANDRANGTFRSISLVRTTGLTDASRFQRPMPQMEFVAGGFARAYTQITEGDGFYWGSIDSNLLWKIDKTTLQEVAQYTLPTSPQYGGIVYNSGYIYWWNNSPVAKFYRYDVATGVTEASATIADGPNIYNQQVSFHISGGYLWWIFLTASGKVCRIALSTFTTVGTESKTFSGFSSILSGGYQIIHNGNFCFLASKSAEYGGRHVWWRMNWAAGTTEVETDLQWGIDDGAFNMARFFQWGGNTYLFLNYVNTFTAGQDVAGRNLVKIVNMTGPQAGIMSSRKLLANPVTKTSAYKMRISYELQYA